MDRRSFLKGALIAPFIKKDVLRLVEHSESKPHQLTVEDIREFRRVLDLQRAQVIEVFGIPPMFLGASLVREPTNMACVVKKEVLE